MKTYDDVCIIVADLAYKKGEDKLNFFQKHLYNYIEFEYYIINGGGTGFLYNISTDTAGQNHHQKYTDSFRYFGFNDIASELDGYFSLYQSMVLKWLNLNIQDFSDIFDKSELPKLRIILDEKLQELSSKGYEIINQWIIENYESLDIE